MPPQKKRNKKNPVADATPTFSGDTGGGEETNAPLGGAYRGPVNPRQDFVFSPDLVQGYARYYDGAQDEPYGMDPESVANLQATLIQLGMLSKKNVRLGVWDPTSASAYKGALTWANKLGVTFDDLVGQLMESGYADGSGGGGGGGGGGLGAAPPSDEDIIALANKVAQGVLGRNLRDEEIGNFIPAFRGVYDNGTTPQVSAENIVRQQTAPVEAGAHDLGNAFDVFGQLLGGR